MIDESPQQHVNDRKTADGIYLSGYNDRFSRNALRSEKVVLFVAPLTVSLSVRFGTASKPCALVHFSSMFDDIEVESASSVSFSCNLLGIASFGPSVQRGCTSYPAGIGMSWNPQKLSELTGRERITCGG